MNPVPVLEPEWYTPAQLAEKLATDTNTLSKLRQDGSGPRFTKLGRQVRYLNHDVLRWHNATARTSTREDH